jgi:16S rRNA (guanine966-N2)-methyltransferase
VRVIAGKLGGRLFASPSSERTHPMSDKIRGALFNTLGDIEGLTILDAFTGSGALGFEAISRGASHVTALDVDALAIGSVELSLDQLGITADVKAIRVGAASWLKTVSPDKTFDIVLCDPPYDDPQLQLVTELAPRAKVGGLVVLSLPSDVYPALPQRFELVMTKSYGDARLYFYRRAS